MTFPIYIANTPDAAEQLPTDEPIFYVVAKNGVFMGINNNWTTALVPVKDGIVGLEELKIAAQWKLPKLPVEIMHQAVKFFHEVMEKHDTEAAVMVHYSEKLGWALSCPTQTVTPGHVSYEMTDRIPGYRCIGTMHSHVKMSAFHSGVDEKDEAEFDGLHITIGMVDKFEEGKFDMAAELVIRGQKFKMASELFAEGVVPNVKDEDETSGITGMFKWSSSRTPSHMFTNFATLPDVTVPPEWHDKVTAQTYSYGRFYGGGYFGNNVVDDDEQDLGRRPRRKKKSKKVVDFTEKKKDNDTTKTEDEINKPRDEWDYFNKPN